MFSYALETRKLLRFEYGCTGYRMLLEHERNYGLGMDALLIALPRTRTELWFGHGCTRYTICFWNTNGIMVWAWMHSLPYARGTRTELWCGHGCTGCCRVLLEHERNGLSMDALVTVCSWNKNGIMLWAWMLSYSLSLEHEHEQNYGLGMDALVTVCSWNTSGIMHGCSPNRTP